MHHLISRRAGLGALTAGALLAALALAPAAPAATVKACQKKKGGALRVISGKAKCNKKTEKSLSWNTTGPAGKNGANGTNGASGTNGTNGTNGKDGKNGTDGGRGPSNAFYVGPDGAVASLDNTNKVLATLNLPAGTFVLFGRVTIQRGVTGGETDCSLRRDGTQVASFYNVLAPSPSPNAFVGGLSSFTGLTLAAPATITLTCKDITSTAIVSEPRIAAIQVESLN